MLRHAQLAGESLHTQTTPGTRRRARLITGRLMALVLWKALAPLPHRHKQPPNQLEPNAHREAAPHGTECRTTQQETYFSASANCTGQRWIHNRRLLCMSTGWLEPIWDNRSGHRRVAHAAIVRLVNTSGGRVTTGASCPQPSHGLHAVPYSLTGQAYHMASQSWKGQEWINHPSSKARTNSHHFTQKG